MDGGSSGQLTPEFERQKRRLLAEVRDGSAPALAKLLDMYRPFLRLWGHRSAGDQLRRKFDTSDVIQNTHEAALKRIDAFQAVADEDFSKLLRQIFNAQISEDSKPYRRVKKRSIHREQPLDGHKSWDQLINMLATEPGSVTEQVSQDETRQRVEAVLDRLKAPQQRLLRQRLWESLSWEQIAQLHDCTEDAARMRFKRAIAKCAQVYRREYPDA